MSDQDHYQSPRQQQFLGFWWGKLVFAGGLWAFAGYLYFALNNLEQFGGNMRVHALVAAAYNLGGVWGAVGLTAGVGAVFFAWGVSQRCPAPPPPVEIDFLAVAEHQLRQAGV